MSERSCPYCGSVNYIYKDIIDNELMVDSVEIYRVLLCIDCYQDYVEHSTYVATSFESITMEEYDEEESE